ncbi:MAG: hypothetical protein ACOX6T_04160 [Myxococcales bacterium]|jgi:hypothetical protein
MTKAKFRKRTKAWPPDSGFSFGCLLLAAVVLGAPPLIAWAAGIGWLAVVLGVPAAYVLASWLFGRLLLVSALLLWRPRGIRGVLVYSESPTWKRYIEEEWLPRIGTRMKHLNWSARASWGNALPVLLWRHYCGYYRGGSGSHHNFNPAVILLRGLRRPLVFRFHGPFQAAKHGDIEGLKALERQLFEALGDSSARGPVA